MSDKLKAHLLHMAAVRPLMDGEAARWAVGRIAELEGQLRDMRILGGKTLAERNDALARVAELEVRLASIAAKD